MELADNRLQMGTPGSGSAPSTTSPDGQFLWDGRQWIPTVTPDGRWRWNGSGWEPIAALDERNPSALAKTLLAQAEETYAQSGALLAGRRGEWPADAPAQARLHQADQLVAAVQASGSQLAELNQQNVINRALAGSDRRRIESELAEATATLRAVIIQIGRAAPSATFPDADVLLAAGRRTEAQAREITEALEALLQADAAHAARLVGARQRLQQAEAERSSALAAAAVAVQAARQSHEQALETARAVLGAIRMPGAGEPVASVAGVALYANHVQTLDGRGPTEGVRVELGTAQELVAGNPAEVTQALALSSTGAPAFHEAEMSGARDQFLLLEAGGLRSLVPVPVGLEDAAADFMAKVPEAAALAAETTARRIAAERSARAELERLTTDRAEISAAEADLARAETDARLLGAVQDQRTAYRQAHDDTDAVEAARTRLAAAVNAALMPPPPLVG